MTEPALRVGEFAEVDESRVCYFLAEDGVWMLHLPGVGLGSLAAHTITVHDDGTISAEPSVLVKCGGAQRHGFLRHGEWTEC